MIVSIYASISKINSDLKNLFSDEFKSQYYSNDYEY